MRNKLLYYYISCLLISISIPYTLLCFYPFSFPYNILILGASIAAILLIFSKLSFLNSNKNITYLVVLGHAGIVLTLDQHRLLSHLGFAVLVMTSLPLVLWIRGEYRIIEDMISLMSSIRVNLTAIMVAMSAPIAVFVAIVIIAALIY